MSKNKCGLIKNLKLTEDEISWAEDHCDELEEEITKAIKLSKKIQCIQFVPDDLEIDEDMSKDDEMEENIL